MSSANPSLPRRLLQAVATQFDSDRRAAAPFPKERLDRVDWPRLWPFALLHLGCFVAIWTGVSPIAIAIAVLLYGVRMFAITAVYHRYLSHRAFTAPRWLVFVGAFVAASSAQRGPLWWAAHHRRHHRHADSDGDAHSPRAHGFWWAHIGWFTTRRNFVTDRNRVKDLAARPELVWLDRFDVVPPLVLALALFGLGEGIAAWMPSAGTSGLQLVVWGFCISTVVLFHVTSLVNSLGHVVGSRPYATPDQSRNALWLALLTFGEGWHNNHHFCPGAVRQGFRWWQVDLSFYLLWLLERVGLVQLRALPARAKTLPARAKALPARAETLPARAETLPARLRRSP